MDGQHDVWCIKDGTESLVFREDDQRFRIEDIGEIDQKASDGQAKG